MMTRILITLLFLMLAAGKAQAFNLDINKLIDAGKSAADMKPVDEKGEADIGKTAAANILGAAPLLKNDPLEAYVNRVGLWLALQSERPDLPWKFGVLDTDSVNAFAAPGGYVFITRGLLIRMRSEAELAGVMAHEISHVVKKHHLNAIQKNAQVGLATNLMSAFSPSTGSFSDEAKKKLISVSNELYARGLDQGDEFEADRMGVVLAARAGYDPYGLPATLQTLESMSAQDGSLALMFKTHPAPQKRLELLDAAMSGTLDRYGSQPQLAERFVKEVGESMRR